MDIIKEYVLLEEAFIFLSWPSLIYAAEAFLLLWLAKYINHLASPKYGLNEQLLEQDNKALSLSFVGYMLGIGIILLGVLEDDAREGWVTNPLWDNVISLGIWGVIGIISLNVARVINDKCILHRFNNVKEIIVDKNVGTGAVQFGSYVGSALILKAVITSGESFGFAWDVLDTAIYFFISQGFFVIFGLVYQRITSYDLHDEIEKDNGAAGVAYGLTLTAIGIILSHPISHTHSLAALAVWFVNGVILLILTRLAIDKLILPGRKLDDEIAGDRNWGIALLEGGLALIIALIINASFSF